MASYNDREDNPYLPETTRTDEESPIAKDEAEWGESERAAVRAMFPDPPEVDPDGPCPRDIATCGGPGYSPVSEYSSRCSECHTEWVNSDLREALEELKSAYRQRFLDLPFPGTEEHELGERDAIKTEKADARIALLSEWDGWETEAFDFPGDLDERGY